MVLPLVVDVTPLWMIVDIRQMLMPDFWLMLLPLLWQMLMSCLRLMSLPHACYIMADVVAICIGRCYSQLYVEDVKPHLFLNLLQQVWWLMLLPGGRWNNHCRVTFVIVADVNAMGSWSYFNLSSEVLSRTSSQMWGRWYLPMFLSSDGLLTLMYSASLIALLRFWFWFIMLAAHTIAMTAFALMVTNLQYVFLMVTWTLFDPWSIIAKGCACILGVRSCWAFCNGINLLGMSFYFWHAADMFWFEMLKV